MTVSPGEIQAFITSFEERLPPVEKASSEAWWNLATTGTEEAQKNKRMRLEVLRSVG